MLRVAAYLGAALALLIPFRREWQDHDREGRWPGFWLSTAALLAVMGASRAIDLDEVATSLGRGRAQEGGWYESRSALQVPLLAAICVAWATAVAVALWRVPERRRRHLPTALAVLSLICYVAVRMVSLHQVDAALYERDLGGVRVGALVEMVLLVITGLAARAAGRQPGGAGNAALGRLA